MTAIEATLDALMNKMGNNERIMHTTLVVGIVDAEERRKSTEEGSFKDSEKCSDGFLQ